MIQRRQYALTMQFVTILPPFVQSKVCPADKRRCVVVDLAIKWKERFINLRYQSEGRSVCADMQMYWYDTLF